MEYIYLLIIIILGTILESYTIYLLDKSKFLKAQLDYVYDGMYYLCLYFINKL